MEGHEQIPTSTTTLSLYHRIGAMHLASSLQKRNVVEAVCIAHLMIHSSVSPFTGPVTNNRAMNVCDFAPWGQIIPRHSFAASLPRGK